MNTATYVGPFVEWLVRRDDYAGERQERAQETIDFLSGSEPHLSPTYTPEVTIQGEVWLRKVFHAYFPSRIESRAPRLFQWPADQPDHSYIFEFPNGFDVKGEMEWLEREFASDIELLSQVFESRPTMKWGVLDLWW